MKGKIKDKRKHFEGHARFRIDPSWRSKAKLRTKGEALALSQDSLRALVETTSDWIWEIDAKGTYTYVSPKVEELLGYRADEVLGKTPYDLMPAREADRIARVVKPLFEKAQPISNLENINVHRDGHLVVLESSGVPIFDSSGKLAGYRGIDRDITGRKQMEEALKKSEQRFRSLSEASLEAILFIEDGIIVDANQALNRLLGYEDEDLRGRVATDFIAPELREASNEKVWTRTEGIYETLGLRKDGTTIPLEINAREFQANGKRVRITAAHDLTERKKIEQQLKDYQEHLERLVQERTDELHDKEKQYREIFEDAVVGIYRSTPQGRFLMANPALAHIFGYGSSEEMVQSVTDIGTDIYTDPDHRKDLLMAMETDGYVKNFEIKARRKDGQIRYVSLNGHSLKDKSGKILYFEGTIQDITEKKSAFEQMVMQRDLAQKLAKTGSLTEGLSIILHTALLTSGMECGAISLQNKKGGFDLVHAIGMTDDFLRKVRRVEPGSFTWSQVTEKKSFHMRPTRELTPASFEEGFTFISVMPILQDDEVMGILVTASKVLSAVPEQVRIGLELLAAESGSVIARMQARHQLEEEIATREETEKALEAERKSLIEANAALKVLLKHRDEDKKELEERFLSNVQQLVIPHVEKLKKSDLDPVQHMSVSFIETNLNDLVSPFLKRIQGFNFTPRQLEVASLIREGRTTKDITRILNMNQRAVEIQRFLIRKKLGFNKEKVNLQAYLKSLS